MNQMFEPGQYRGRVTRWALVKAKNEKKTPQFAMSFIPLGRINPHNPDADLDPCPDVERTIFRSITEKTADWLLQDLKAHFDYPHDRFTPLDPDGSDAFDFGNKEFTAYLSYEEYDGKPRERWNFSTGQLFTGEPMNASDVRKLDALFGAAKPKRPSRKNGQAPATPPTDAATQPAPVQI